MEVNAARIKNGVPRKARRRGEKPPPARHSRAHRQVSPLPHGKFFCQLKRIFVKTQKAAPRSAGRQTSYGGAVFGTAFAVCTRFLHSAGFQPFSVEMTRIIFVFRDPSVRSGLKQGSRKSQRSEIFGKEERQEQRARRQAKRAACHGALTRRAEGRNRRRAAKGGEQQVSPFLSTISFVSTKEIVRIYGRRGAAKITESHASLYCAASAGGRADDGSSFAAFSSSPLGAGAE